jgi:ribosomal protein L37E
MSRGVECRQCGASTPLPDDLRVPTFTCAFCHRELRTADYAGEMARGAAEMGAFFQRVLERPHDVGQAPRLPTANRAATRPSTCRRCGAAVSVSLDLRVHDVTCAACGWVDAVSAHVSDAERMQLDMQQQIAANDAYKRLIEAGIACGSCGGHNAVPDDGTLQFVCRFCGHAILLSDHVDEGAVARRRLRNDAYALRDGLKRKQQKESRIVAIVVLSIVAVVVVATGVSLALWH